MLSCYYTIPFFEVLSSITNKIWSIKFAISKLSNQMILIVSYSDCIVCIWLAMRHSKMWHMYEMALCEFQLDTQIEFNWEKWRVRYTFIQLFKWRVQKRCECNAQIIHLVLDECTQSWAFVHFLFLLGNLHSASKVYLIKTTAFFLLILSRRWHLSNLFLVFLLFHLFVRIQEIR